MVHFSMLFANFYHYAGRSDSLGIINLLAVSLILSVARFRAGVFQSSDRCFELRSLAGQI